MNLDDIFCVFLPLVTRCGLLCVLEPAVALLVLVFLDSSRYP
jgi:hypothetical protein